MAPLSSHSLRVLEGFGGASRAACRYTSVADVASLIDVLALARKEGHTVTFRGAGQSYGDAALNADGLVVDLRRLSRVLSWEPETGVLEAEPGVTIEGVWRRTLEDGYWPAVVPGTQRATLGGCIATNVHGKNHPSQGTFGEHVEELELVTPLGEKRVLSRTKDADLFHAVIGGMGLLGAVTRAKMKLRRVQHGSLEVTTRAAPSVDALFDEFERALPNHEFNVAWLDAHASGGQLGRGVLESARFPSGPREDASVDGGPASLHVETQRAGLGGLVHRHAWHALGPLTSSDALLARANALRFQWGKWKTGKTASRPLAAYAFPLDAVDNWQRSYGLEGFVQHQLFVPHAAARTTFRAVLERCQEEGLVPSLAVMKRHRADPFVLSYGLDGWSLALDFRVTRLTRQRLWGLTEILSQTALGVGGTFYLAKDSVLRAEDFERAYGKERLSRFLQYKRRVDPGSLVTSDLARRLFRMSPGA